MCETCNLSRRNFLKSIAIGAGALALNAIPSLEALAESQDVKIKTHQTNGPADKRVNLIFVPEGFTAKEQKKFEDYVQQVITTGFKDFIAYKEIAPLINFYSAFVPSNGPYKGDGKGPFGVKWDNFKNPTEYDSTKTREIHDLLKKDTKDLANYIMHCIIVNDSSVPGYSKPDEVIGTTNLEVTMHELGHGFGQGDEYPSAYANGDAKGSFADYPFEKYGTLNVDIDGQKPRWQPALDKKVKGVKTNLITGTKNAYRGEEGTCLMKDIKPGTQLGPICALGVLLYAREKSGGIVETATAEELITAKKGAKPGIELKVIPTASYVPQVQAWYTTGTPEEMDELSGKLREEATADTFKDKRYKKFEMAYDAKKKIYTPKTAIPVGSHSIAMLLNDPNPAIFMDPESVTTAKRFYRVDVAEK